MNRSRRLHAPDPVMIDPCDQVLHGQEIGMPMLDCAVLSHRANARPMKWHSHEGHEFILLLRGSTSYEFPGGKSVPLSGGQFMLVPAGTRHRGVRDVRMPSTLCAILFKTTRSHRGRCEFAPRELAWIERQCQGLEPGACRLNPSQRQMVQTLVASLNQPSAQRVQIDAAAALRLLVSSLILESIRAARRMVEPTASDRIARVIQHLEQHFTRPLPIDDMTEISGYGRARLFTLFKEETGLSPNDWLQRRRVKAATTLLQTTARKLEDIATATGFSSAAYFCQVFRKYTGKTPGEHRQKQTPRLKPQKARQTNRHPS